MKKYVKMSFVYTIVAMVLGVFYREFTKFQGFTGTTRLSVLHTHYFALGMMMCLLFAVLQERTRFTEQKFGKVFFIFYNIGLNITGAMLFARGMTQVLLKPAEINRGIDFSISGIAGLGHILLGIGIVLFFLSLFRTAMVKDS